MGLALPSRASCFALFLSIAALTTIAQNLPSSQPKGSSWPQVYPGMPTGDYSPEWQTYFQVTKNLPNVSWPLARNWAGNIPVQRAGHPNNTLFFWAFESSNGSFTTNSSKPWGIWLNGGPGVSSLLGLLFENGPIHVLSNYSVAENEYAWTTVADYVWIDQPVGTGFSTADADGYVVNNEQAAADFNLVKVFPSLATRPLHITGESFAGTYIPYITKAYFEMDTLPVNLSGIAIGDGTLTTFEVFEDLCVVSVLETYPQIIGYNTQVFEYFREQSALCGYNLTLRYPQPGYFPTLNAPLPSDNYPDHSAKYSDKLTKTRLMQETQDRLVARFGDSHGPRLDRGKRLRAHDVWKRDLTGRANGSIDPWYQCDLYNEMVDYPVNFTFPWSLSGEFDHYNIPDALSPEATMDASVFLNDSSASYEEICGAARIYIPDAQTRTAIHAPTSTDWVEFITYPFLLPNGTVNPTGDPSIEPMAFLTDLATNATAHNISIVIFSGNDDSLIPHLSSEIAIQNTTFGGIQGFTRKPDTPWYNDAGELAGIVHQERGWKYILVGHGGHVLGYTNPVSALTLAREFIFGNNQTGLVTTSSNGAVSVVGGEASLGEILTGQAGIYYGQATTASTYFFPSETVDAWNAYIATATATTSHASAASRLNARSVWSMGARLVWMIGPVAITLLV